MLRILFTVGSLVIVTCFIACRNEADLIPGRYVYMAESASGKAWDTLDITKDPKGGNDVFTMIYKMTYSRKQPDGSWGEQTHTRDTLSLIYSEDEHVLMIKEWLRPVPADLEAGTLKFAESTFTKLR
jgi:hypothetical protein